MCQVFVRELNCLDKKMNLCSWLFTYSLAISCCANFVFASNLTDSDDDAQLAHQVSAIDELIATKCPTFDVDKIIKIARDEYKRLVKINRVDDDCSKILKLASLATLKDENHCEDAGVDIMRKLNIIVNHHKQQLMVSGLQVESGSGQLTRLVQQMSTLDAVACEQVCLLRFKSRLNLVDKNKKKQIESILDSCVKKFEGNRLLMRSKGWFDFAQRLSQERIANRHETVDYLLNHLNKGVDARVLSDSCDHYVKQLGPGLFNVVDYYSSWNQHSTTGSSEYYKTYAGYQLCLLIKNNRHLDS